MDKKALSNRLRALATGDEKRSKAARLRDIFDDVELALSAGITRENVRAELAAHGLEMSLSTFETTLKRIRAQRARMGHIIPARSQNGISQKLTTLSDPKPYESHTGDKPPTTSHDPADLDRIINSQPDLAALAKAAKKRSTK